MKRFTRRDFLKDSGKAAAAVGLGSASLKAAGAARAAGANERVNVALIGCGGRGRYVAYGMVKEGARMAYLCDPHPGRLEEGWKFVSRVQDEKPRMVKDMRKVFEDPDVDGVVIATPDHWHALATVRACQAGKDVYVEKPHAHNLWESWKMMEAAEKYDRVVQVGVQNRSAPYVQAAKEYVDSGKLGGVPLVKVYNMKSGGRFTLGSAGQCPSGFDWDEWLGPTPERPYHEHIFRHGYRKYWTYCGGDLAGDGIHQLDLAMKLMGDPGVPKSVRCVGGRYAYPDDDAEVPDLQMASWDFGDFIMTGAETRYPRYMLKTTGTIRRNEEQPYWTHNSTRVELYGSDLMMTIGRHGGGWIVQRSGGDVVKKVFGKVPDSPHYRNFLECIKSREAPNADIRIVHPSMACINMANVALRAGNTALNYDAEAGSFHNDKADALIKRTYRPDYEVPERV